MKKNFKHISIPELKRILNEYKEQPYRLDQILSWLYVKKISDFNLMTNLPKSLIYNFSDNFVINEIPAKSIQTSSDGTKKYIFDVNSDNNNILNNSAECEKSLIETVGIPSLENNTKQLTICVSTQIGCNMSCRFCATGKQGFTRNLYPLEIVDQVVNVQNDFNCKASNIVIMGQGEPFMNFNNLIDALEIINNSKLLNIGARKITISTCGITSGIDKLSVISKQYGLAISLHSAIQSTRNYLMPGVINVPLNKLKNSIVNYINKTNRRVTFEYLLLNNINDDDKHLRALIDFCNGLLCHVNLLKFNEILESEFKPSNQKLFKHWTNTLKNNHIETTIRKSRGADIDAACGQLINQQ